MLHQAQRRDPTLPPAESWGEVLEFPSEVGSQEDHRGSYAAAALRAYHEDRNPAWLTVLLALFWSRLLFIWRQSAWKLEDRDDLWMAVQESFLEAVERESSSSVKAAPWSQLWFATKTRLRTYLRRVWSLGARTMEPDGDDESTEEDATPRSDIRHLADPNSLDPFTEVEEQVDREKRISALRFCVRRGWINEAEGDLLLGVLIYGESIRAYSKRQGADYELLRKRYQRAREKLERRKMMSLLAGLIAFPD